MKRFALIAEGWTDIAVIENIVYGLCGNDGVVNPLMPLQDATDAERTKEKNFSNWELVFQYLASQQVQIALSTNDYLIVHVDTDEGDHENFGLPLTKGGVTKSISDIVSECKTLLIAKLPKDIAPADVGRIIFAIPVLSTECWLVGLHDAKHTHAPSKANNCLQRLYGAVQKKMKVSKKYRCYQALSSGFSKHKTLTAVQPRVECLDIFVRAMP